MSEIETNKKNLKVYIAAPWANRTEAQEAQKKFEAAGFEVTAHWITRPSTIVGDVFAPENAQELTSEAVEDIEDIIKSDIFVVLNLDMSEGKATEFGFAYALGIPTILVGERTRNIFYYLSHVFRAKDVEQVIDGLIEIDQTKTNLENLVQLQEQKEGEVVN